MSSEHNSITDPRNAIIEQQAEKIEQQAEKIEQQAEKIERQAKLLSELQEKVERLQSLLEGKADAKAAKNARIRMISMPNSQRLFRTAGGSGRSRESGRS